MTSIRVKAADSTISICAWVPYPPDSTPSQRFRIEQWKPYLESRGIKIDLFPFADCDLMQLLHRPGHQLAKAASMTSRFARRALDVVAAARYDAVMVHRAACIAGPALFERLVRIPGVPIIYDFDDAIFKLHTTTANRRVGWLKFPGKTATLCRISSHIVAGNSYLADYARLVNPRVTIIPSSVDTNTYLPVKTERPNSPLVVGWMGSSTSQTHLEWFAPVLSELVARHRVEIRVVSDRQSQLPNVPHVWRRWSARTEVEELGGFDIGIMPMPDDEWARGKCAFKALQYMAMEVATICSNVGANREVIRHGENGFLAATREEWIDSFDRLIGDADLRTRLGRAGRRTVEERYSMTRCGQMMERVIRETVERPEIAADYDLSSEKVTLGR